MARSSQPKTDVKQVEYPQCGPKTGKNDKILQKKWERIDYLNVYYKSYTLWIASLHINSRLGKDGQPRNDARGWLYIIVEKTFQLAV